MGFWKLFCDRWIPGECTGRHIKYSRTGEKSELKWRCRLWRINTTHHMVDLFLVCGLSRTCHESTQPNFFSFFQYFFENFKPNHSACVFESAVCCHRQCRMEYVMRHELNCNNYSTRTSNFTNEQKKKTKVFYSKNNFQGYYENHVLHTRTADAYFLLLLLHS